jgi:uncharacterized protein with PIN domain
VSSSIRFYLDEHIPNAIAEGVRRRGIDVLTISEAGKLGASDEEHFAFARQQGRVIVTHDTDFLRLAADSSDHSGVVYAPQERTIGEMVRKLSLIARVIKEEKMRGHIEYI